MNRITTLALALSLTVLGTAACKKSSTDSTDQTPAGAKVTSAIPSPSTPASPAATCGADFTQLEGACIKLAAGGNLDAPYESAGGKTYQWTVPGGSGAVAIWPSNESVDERLGQVSPDWVTSKGDVPDGKWIAYKDPSDRSAYKVAIKTKAGMVQCDAMADRPDAEATVFDTCRTLIVR